MSVPNIEKLFQYLSAVSLKPIELGPFRTDRKSYPAQTFGDPVQSVVLNDTFFYTDNCYMCGGCDPAESNLFTVSEFARIKACTDKEFEESGLDPSYLHMLKAGLEPTVYNINGKDVMTYVFKQRKNWMYLPVRGKELNRCTWCFQEENHKFKCRIHPVESITCIMPHLRFYHFPGSSRSSMGIHQFGRNWALGCQVQFSEPLDEDEFERNKADRIEKLWKLYQCGLDLNVDTHIPQIVEFIEDCTFENHKDYFKLNMLIPKKTPIKFFPLD